ncbi:Hpt domain-containing protein [Larkinella sp. VNQ87]|uniref:Hpt domain-containing protein n=1 Tax=Larkinella sp. VNQ87 TaxID=3400921 RepID=UPI003C0AF1F6
MDSSVTPRSDDLDRRRLYQVYGDDTDTIASFIALFLSDVIPHFTDLENELIGKEWGALAERAHQLRSWLAMVGLTKLENQLLHIEEQARNNPDECGIRQTYTTFREQLNQMIPVLIQEVERLNRR